MTKNADADYRINVDSAQADRLIALADDTFLNLTMYLQLFKSGIGTDRLEKMPNAALLRFYMERLHDIYEDKVFADALKVLAVVLTAREPLTVEEIAALAGRGEPDLMLLAYMKDLAPFMKNIHASQTRKANVYTAANEGYADYITKEQPETCAEIAAIFTDTLETADLEQYKDEKGNYDIPDGLFYMAAYLPTVTDGISEKLRDKVYIEDKKRTNIYNCVTKKREKHGALCTDPPCQYGRGLERLLREGGLI